MKNSLKEQLLEIVQTLLQVHRQIENHLNEKEVLLELLTECQNAAISIGNILEKDVHYSNDTIENLESYCELLYGIYQDSESCICNIDKIIEEMDGRIRKTENEIIRDLHRPFQIVFMPYKASMWTSLESIWRAALDREDCDVKVVVAPYQTLDADGKCIRVVDESSLFPQYVSLTSYKEYDVTNDKPDMIFIHNPYDETNYVTRVLPQFYSSYLKSYTNCLVYSPYGMIGYYNPDKGVWMPLTKATRVVDKILVQSERVKEIYLKYGHPERRIISIGSPKVDALVERNKREHQVPPEWEKLNGKKVFLLNTHLSYFSSGAYYQEKNPGCDNYAIKMHESIMKYLLDKTDVALIWRPHPLLKETLISRNMIELVEYVESLEQRIECSTNAVLDRTGDYSLAFNLSDALLSTYSSLVAEYMLTGKPIFIYESRLKEKNMVNSPIDYSHLYYKAQKGENAKFPTFVEMVCEGKDYLGAERKEDINRAFCYLDGTIGERILGELLEEYY